MPDRVHMMIAIPPRYAVSQVLVDIKGKSAIHLARGYFVSTVSRDEAVIRAYIRNQGHEEQRIS